MSNRGPQNVNYEWDFLPQTESPFHKIEEEEEGMEEEHKQTEEDPKGYGGRGGKVGGNRGRSE